MVDGWFFALEEDVLAGGDPATVAPERLLEQTNELLEKRLAAINRVGVEAPWNIGEFYGSSYFCDPRGKILATGPRKKDALVTATLDLDQILEARKVWQFFRDRRPETYREIVEQLP